ncbi:MAG TPA: hypothetical protein VJ984_12935 [Xanthomonadales bacterium]|nr:hypothetical protein [Xanthomonadales bacterium]
METFAEVRNHVMQSNGLGIDEPFIVSFDYPVGDQGRKQGVFLAELKTNDGRRVLRVETPVVPLTEVGAEKCLRLNLTLRVGYLAVGDLDSVPYIKLCENLPYAFLEAQELDYTISHIAKLADQIEQMLEPDNDVT